MHIKYFGDSYDVVKQSLIRWLGGEWSVHPMLTEAPKPSEAEAFATFLGARLLSETVLTAQTDRTRYFACASNCHNLLLDPDTGLQLESFGGKRTPKFLFANELVSLARQRPAHLTLVFDQSHPRGSRENMRASLNKKLRHLSGEGIFGFAYESHACFLISGPDSALITRAYGQLVSRSRLPATRFVRLSKEREN